MDLEFTIQGQARRADEDAARNSMRFLPRGRLARVFGSIPVSFRNEEKERIFRQQKKKRLRHVMCRICSVALVAHLLAVLAELPLFDFSSDLTDAARLFLGNLSIVALTSACGLVCNVPEVLVPWLFVIGVIGILLTSRSRAAFLTGESLEVAFSNIATVNPVAYCSLLSDAVVIGNLACLIVVYFVVLPVRAIVGSWLVVAIPLLYLGFTLFMIEKDGSMARTLSLMLRLIICCTVGLIGRCYIEMGERLAFYRVQKVEEDLTQEKILRFAAEHESEHGPFAAKTNEHQMLAGRPAGAASAASGGVISADSASAGASMVSAAASVVSRPLSSIIFTPSETRDVPVELQLSAMKAVAAEEKWLITWSDVMFHSNLIGKGGYAMVVEGKYAGARVAVKMPSKEQLSTSKEVADFFGKELRVLRHLRHPFIVNFYGACIEENKQLVVLIEEFIDGASLHDSVLYDKGEPLTEDSKWHILSCVCHALAYLHEQGPSILHGDLSAKNIMLRARSLEPVLIDFGMSVLKKSRSKIQGGSPRWMAPELLSALDEGGLRPDCSVDMFAFGRVCFFVSTGRLPLQEFTVDDLMAATKAGTFPAMQWPSDEESELAAFCKADLCPLCVATDPTDRCTAAEARNLLQLQRPKSQFDAITAVEKALEDPRGVLAKQEKKKWHL
ncbi:gefX [Symbiodinium natans]|uniref:GefX protein n=1 Tax=Symbiodinium natans TaxID=878477 RepID=A0A812HWY0_9DINO|nr:gefX [Symbiodinium natans]